MRGRRAARRIALDVLYEAEIRNIAPTRAFEMREREGWVAAEPEAEGAGAEPPGAAALEYARTIVDGVEEHRAALDALLTKYADRWTIERMPVVDRTLLRVALFELLWRDDIPVPVAINEAVEMAKSLSTEDSGRFINGLLGRIVDEEMLPRT